MKAWYTSKTVWLNILGLLVLLVKQATDTHLIPDASIGVSVLGMLNIVMRFVTTMPVGASTQPVEPPPPIVVTKYIQEP